MFIVLGIYKFTKVEEGSAGEKVVDFLGGLLNTLTDVGTKLGDAEVNKVCEKVGLKHSETNPNNNNGGGNNNNGGGNNNNGGENNKSSASLGNTNGGNTVQVSILGMFIILVLAIFNH